MNISSTLGTALLSQLAASIAALNNNALGAIAIVAIVAIYMARRR